MSNFGAYISGDMFVFVGVIGNKMLPWMTMLKGVKFQANDLSRLKSDKQYYLKTYFTVQEMKIKLLS